MSLVEVSVPEPKDADGWRAACAGLPLSHMGRGPDEDGAFFASAFAAGRLAERMLSDESADVEP
jgi:hypothetical protein